LSNWVGIVRRQQNGKLLVQVGDTVRKGQTVCWIDALGVRNEVRAPEAGRIVEIFVEDGQPVEFGQQLMLLEPMKGGD
jgi:biotin carboxyl carrier protein